VLFGASDGSLWAYSFHATALFHVPLAGDLRAPPRPLGQKTWVGVGDDLVLVDGASRRTRVRLGATIEHLAEPLPSGAAVVIAGGELSVLTTRGDVAFRRSGVSWAETVGAEIVAVEPRGRVVWVSADGSERGVAESGVRPTEPPLTLPSGLVCVPGEAGNLALVAPGGAVTRVAVAKSALHSPVHDVARKRLVVASGDGTLASLPVGE
jgi:hypothetical protein